MNNETLALEMNDEPMIFGLTYLEEEDLDVADVIGCGAGGYSGTGCDDTDVPPGTQIP